VIARMVQTMMSRVSILLSFMIAVFRTYASVRLENLALRHQVAVYKQSISRPKLRPIDRLFRSCLSRLWPDWQQALEFVSPWRNPYCERGNRQYPPRFARPCHRPEPPTPDAPTEDIPQLLSSISDPSCTRHGLPSAARHSASRNWASEKNS